MIEQEIPTVVASENEPDIDFGAATRFETYCIAASTGGAFTLWILDLGLPLAITTAFLPYLLRHLILLHRLAILIRRHHRLAPPFPWGLWGVVFRNIAQYQQRGRKRRKRQIRFTRRFREAAVALPDGLVVLNKQQRIEWANPAAGALMNVQWPRDDGKRLTETLRHPQLGDLLEAGEQNRAIQIVPNHNRAMMLSLRITPFGERKRQRLVVARDITKIYHLNMIRRDFVANASHELRTPLTVIAGFLENLSDSPATPDEHRRPLDLMRNQSERMRSIIEDLLTLSKLEMEDRTIQVEPVDVPNKVRSVLREAQALSDGSHEFVTEIEERLLIVGNPAELHSAISNLIHNAVKHTPSGTRIRIIWTEDGLGPMFSVEDDGDGIAPEHIPRLTERFYRVDKARSRASGGTGLGLAIVKHVLARHDGRLLIASEVGQGSTFTCRFPESSSVYRDQLGSGEELPEVHRYPGNGSDRELDLALGRNLTY